MNISGFSLFMIGSNARAFPLPAVAPGTSTPQPNICFMAVVGGPIYIRLGGSALDPSVTPGNASIIVQPGAYSVSTGQAATVPYVGPIVTVPLNEAQSFSACVGPQSTIVAVTTASASSGATVLTVASPTGIQVGQGVQDFAGDIPTGTVVTALSGTSVTLSQATTAALSSAAVAFSSLIANPAVLAVGIGN